MIIIVNYDAGNVGSVLNICRKAGGLAKISSDPATIASATKLILPGVGHFGRAMQRLEQSGLVAALHEAVMVRRVPILGICLGMQLFSSHSDEGDAAGLGWIAAHTVRFSFDAPSPLKIPHMGWNTMDPRRSTPLFDRLPEAPRFYFVHSYHVVCDDEADILATTMHGIPFASAIGHANIWGTQFHPEKSHKYGVAVMRNFVDRVDAC